ncbi:hypothetical protein ACIBD9_17960 [Micromonospora sp. NPDC050784]
MIEILDPPASGAGKRDPAELPRHEGIALPVTEPFDRWPNGDLH